MITLLGLLLYHFETHITGFHFLQVFHFSFTYNLAEQQQQFSLTICQCITFNVVAVEVEIHCKLAAETLAVPVGKRLYGIPGIYMRSGGIFRRYGWGRMWISMLIILGTCVFFFENPIIIQKSMT